MKIGLAEARGPWWQFWYQVYQWILFGVEWGKFCLGFYNKDIDLLY